MMRAPSYPPFVVFFDTVVIFMVLLLLNQKSGVTLEFPQDKLIQGARVVELDKNTDAVLDLFTGNSLTINSNYIYFHEPCGSQEECMHAKQRFSEKKLAILIGEKTTEEVSKITSLSMRNGVCTSLSISISSSGAIDRRKTVANNPCLKRITGVDAWVGI